MDKATAEMLFLLGKLDDLRHPAMTLNYGGTDLVAYRKPYIEDIVAEKAAVYKMMVPEEAKCQKPSP